MHLEELDEPEQGSKVITWQEYVSRLHELKDEINRAWRAEDRVTALKLSIKVSFTFRPPLLLIKDLESKKPMSLYLSGFLCT